MYTYIPKNVWIKYNSEAFQHEAFQHAAFQPEAFQHEGSFIHHTHECMHHTNVHTYTPRIFAGMRQSYLWQAAMHCAYTST